jgi:hypothetical protein
MIGKPGCTTVEMSPCHGAARTRSLKNRGAGVARAGARSVGLRIVCRALPEGRVLGLVLPEGRVLGLALPEGRVLGLALPEGRVLGLALHKGRVLGLVLPEGRVLGLALLEGRVERGPRCWLVEGASLRRRRRAGGAR